MTNFKFIEFVCCVRDWSGILCERRIIGTETDVGDKRDFGSEMVPERAKI